MFEKIIYISDQSANVKVNSNAGIAINLMNLHLVFEDKDKKILGEVDDMDGDVVKARFLGEIVNGKLIGGVIRKPALDATIRVIEPSEVPMIVGDKKPGNMLLGMSPFYNDAPVYLNVNGFFSNHFVIIGNSGSGKSCGVSRIFQNLFEDQRLFPYKSNILLFDSSGEYYNAFKNLNEINPNYHYKFITTNEAEDVGEKLRLPIFLLNKDDIALLLQATDHSQLPIIERMLKLVHIFNQDNVEANEFKNHLIAKAIMTILYTNETSPNKRNEVFSILASCSTPEFNLEAVVQGIGYTRKFRECFLIDSKGEFSESVLLTEYVSSFIKDEFDSYEPKDKVYYTLEDLEKALNFTLISEGWLRNENTYGDAVTLKVRLHALIVGPYAKFFDFDQFINLETYLSALLIKDGKKYQIVNINLDDVDDDFAKVITKVFTRLVFEFTKRLENRAGIPFHIIVEEAHRYIQNDRDRYLLGYNIFERVAKEGRKYGAILGLITQRPVDLSDTVISQCSNFLIFKMNHPTDVEYIRKMVPNISDEIIEKQKSLQAGTCLGFGMAFKIPLIVRLKMPSPEPKSANADVMNTWNGNPNNYVDTTVEEDTAVTPSLEPATASQVQVQQTEQKSVAESVQPSLQQTVNNQQPIEVTPTASVLEVPTVEKQPEIPTEVSAINVGQSIELPVNHQIAPIIQQEQNNILNTPQTTLGIPEIVSTSDINGTNITSPTPTVTEEAQTKPVVSEISAIPELGVSDVLNNQILNIPQNAEPVVSSVQLAASQPVISPTVTTEDKKDEEAIKFFNPLTNEQI